MRRTLKAKALRGKEDEELRRLLEENAAELQKFRTAKDVLMSAKVPTAERGGMDSGLLRCLKRNRAILLTVLRERGVKA